MLYCVNVVRILRHVDVTQKQLNSQATCIELSDGTRMLNYRFPTNDAWTAGFHGVHVNMSNASQFYESLPPELPEGHMYLDRLSPRELEVAAHVFNGCSNRSMAAILDVSIKTVEKHRQSIMRKLGIRSSAILVRMLCREQACVDQLTARFLGPNID